MTRSRKHIPPTSAPSSAELFKACDEIVTPGLLSQAIAGVGWVHRDRILTPALMVTGLLRMVAMVVPSFMQLVDQLRKGLTGVAVPVSESAFYKRLHVMPHDIFRAVLQEVTAVVRRTGLERDGITNLASWASGIYAIDDTTLDALMRKTSALLAHPKGAMETLGGRVSCALDLKTGLLAEVLYNPDSAANEKPHFGKLLEVMGTNNLFVLDLGYFSFPLFDRLTDDGNFFVTRLRQKTSYEVVVKGVDTDVYRDSLIYLGKHRADRAAHPVRLVEFKLGQEWHAYITNVLDPRKLGVEQIWKLYRERWGIESVFAVLKQNLKLAFIRPCHTNGILAQLWATLTVYQVLQDLRLRAGKVYGCGCDKISWYNLMQRIGWYGYEQRSVTLSEWLLDGGKTMALEKRGQRQRVPTKLAGKLGRTIKANTPDWTAPPSRAARQGKPEEAPDLTRTRLAGLRRP